MSRGTITLLAMAILLIALPLSAQQGISAKAGMINYFEGKVFLNGEELQYNITKFHQMPPGGVLETPANGRAEVLMSPGVMLWLAEGSRMELVSDQIDAAKVRLLSGNVAISSTEFPKDVTLTLLVDESQVTIANAGVYRLAYSPTRLEVHEGQAEVLRAGVETRVKKGRALMIDEPGSSVARIDKNEAPDGLMLWAQTRDNYIQVANLSAARSALTGGGFGTMGSLAMLGPFQNFGGWMFNPYFGMYTFVPFGSGFASPFGGFFWGPRTVINAYAPYLSGGGWGGARMGSSAQVSRGSLQRGGFSGQAAYGAGTYERGGSSMGRGGWDSGASGIPSRGGYGGGSMGGYSRGSSGGYSGGAVGGGGGGYSGGGAAPSSSGGASMGRGGSSGGGGRGN